ncbi:MAG: energy transducer TonB [Acidobacteriaceae bacterium]|nr:energy transducer TonB [Acidobacteriaceae bacterium]
MTQRLLPTVILLLTLPVVAQSSTEIEAHLRRDYLGQQMLIRGFYGGAHLHYEADGKVIEGGPSLSWTLSAMRIESLVLHDHELLLGGKRIALVYDREHEKFISYKQTLGDIEVSVASDTPMQQAQLVQALDRVFISQKEKLAELAPPHWRTILEKIAGEASTVQATGGDAPSMSDLAKDGWEPPRPISPPDPPFNVYARNAQFSGTPELLVTVGADGLVHDIQIEKPEGFGLDDDAVAGVSTWRFRPAQKEGKVSAVRLRMMMSIHP